MKTASEIRQGMAGFSGTEAYHRLSKLHGRLVCTDGVAWLAENAGAYWLIDAIASYQPQCAKDAALRGIQFWTLKVVDKSAVLSCERDEGDVAITQEIGRTDFPLDEVKLWVEAGAVGEKPCMVCLLPNEH
jgi:hypothetical protein